MTTATEQNPPASTGAVEVRNLRIELVRDATDIVDGIVIEVVAGEVMGLVGESGRGKTTVGMALMGYCRPGGHVVGGDVLIDGHDLRKMSDGELSRLRGGTVAYIPQDPGTALNPALRIGRQLTRCSRPIKARPARRSVTRACASRSRRSRCRRPTSSSSATRTSSRAASSSAWRSRWRLPAGRT